MKKIVYPLLCLGVLASSCSSNEPNVGLEQYVGIDHVRVGELKARAGYEATQNFLPQSGVMTLLLQSSDSDSRYSTSGLEFTPSANGWDSNTPLPWALNSTADWSVFYTSRSTSEYTYNSSSLELTWSVPEAQKDLTEEQFNALDLLYAGGTTSTATITPQLKHAMAKVRVKYFYESGESNFIPDYSKMILKTESSALTKTIKVETGEKWNIAIDVAKNDEQTYNITFRPVGTPTAAEGVFEAIVIPQQVKSFELECYNNAGSSRGYYSQKESFTFEPGCMYTITIYYGGRNFGVGNVTVTPWETVNSVNIETSDE